MKDHFRLFMKLQVAPGGSVGRAGRGRRVATSLHEINVVPLVDVMLVLLIIFMITAPMLQRGIDVTLPVARGQQMAGERLEVTVPASYRQDHRVFFGMEQIRAEALKERVRQKMETSPQKDVFLRGDRSVNLGEFAEVIDLLKAAGVDHVGFVTKAPGER
jgi:biopolymer transport protein TolR